MLERDFQAKLIKKIKEKLPNAIVLKTDPTYKQGIPDLIVLNGSKYAALEVKQSSKAHHQPNQDYYINKINKMGGFGRFIFPENKLEVMNELLQTLRL